MFQVCISNRVLDDLSPHPKLCFVRDTGVYGGADKINPSGPIKFVVEVRHQGSSRRKTIVESPLVSPSDSRTEALVLLSQVKLGKMVSIAKQKTLQDILSS